MKRKFILIHYHLFKNGGTTIEWALKKNFGNAFQAIHAEGETGVVDNKALLHFLRENPHVTAITSHQLRLPAPKHERFRFLEICFVRHPLDRLQSMYHYYRRVEDSTNTNVAMARKLRLREFLVWLRENQPFNVINAQTCFLGNSGRYFFPPSPQHLQHAIACLQELAVVGSVDRFDDSMIVAEHFLQPVFPKLELSYVVQNTRSGRPDTLAERLEKMREECGDEFFAELGRLNELDLQLVESAEAELNRRLRFVPSLDQRRCDFTARCVALQDPRAVA
jgi:hypothetical protein